jgi:hypothetical protein
MGKTLEIKGSGGSIILSGQISVQAVGEELFPIEISTDDLYKKIKGKDLDNPLGLQRVIDLKIQFNEFWDKYKRKEGKKGSFRIWCKLKDEDRKAILDTVELFVLAHPDVQFRPMPETYLNGRRWEDELPKHFQKTKSPAWAKPNTWS